LPVSGELGQLTGGLATVQAAEGGEENSNDVAEDG
jgi:hypothetical protein